MYTAEQIWGRGGGEGGAVEGSGCQVVGVGDARVLAIQRVRRCRDEERCFSEKAEDGRWWQKSAGRPRVTRRHRRTGEPCSVTAATFALSILLLIRLIRLVSRLLICSSK